MKTAVIGIKSAGPFPCLFPRAHEWKDVLPKIFACRAIIITSGAGEWMFTTPSLTFSFYYCTHYWDLCRTTDEV